jgi:hypothetical protein
MKKGTSVRISEDQVSDRFNAEFIDRWAKELEIPASEKSNFGVVCREVACLYAQEYSSLDQRNLAGQVRREIQDLSNAAEDQKYDDVATLRENLSKRACDLLSLRGSLPSTDEPRGPNREVACATVARLCRIGGTAGRVVSKSECEIDRGHLVVMAVYKLALAEEDVILKRRSKDRKGLRAAQAAHKRALEVYDAMLKGLREGSSSVQGMKIERELKAELWAPPPMRNFSKRYAERRLVLRLHAAVSEARGRPFGKWANPDNQSPFVRFVQEFLNLVGYPDQNAAQIINDLAKKEDKGDAVGVEDLRAAGYGAAEIAKRLEIKRKTVEEQLEHFRLVEQIAGEMNLRTRVQAGKYLDEQLIHQGRILRQKDISEHSINHKLRTLEGDVVNRLWELRFLD